jgi:hypothetical protein
LLEALAKANMSAVGLEYMSQSLSKQKIFHFSRDGPIPVISTVGIPQGDPLSPSNFSLVTASVVNILCDEKQSDFEASE